MKTYQKLAEEVLLAGHELFWQEAVDEAQLEELELLLKCKLPESFKQFLREYGGGGPVGAEISGVENGDARIAAGGTVYGDTLACRSAYGLPSGMVVIYFHDDEVCWCLDTNAMSRGECPVIAYDLFQRRRDRTIASDFDGFFREHLSLYGPGKV